MRMSTRLRRSNVAWSVLLLEGLLVVSFQFHRRVLRRVMPVRIRDLRLDRGRHSFELDDGVGLRRANDGGVAGGRRGRG